MASTQVDFGHHKSASLKKDIVSSASLIRDFINVHDVARQLVGYIDKDIKNTGEIHVTHIASGKDKQFETLLLIGGRNG